MGDGVVRRHALIINGDDEPRHLQNVELAAAALKKESPDFNIDVISPSAPTESVSTWSLPDRENISKTIENIAKRSDDDDVFVLYTTGHGALLEKKAHIVLGHGSMMLNELSTLSKKIVSQKRYVMMDQCFGGEALEGFIDGKTSYFSLATADEQSSCHLFTPFFWEQGEDLNQDGVLTFKERIESARQKRELETKSLYYTDGPETSLAGVTEKKGKFKPEVIDIKTKEELEEYLSTLGPYDHALVTFSADWCGPCQDYKAIFNKIASDGNGKYLMLRLEGIDGSERLWDADYKIKFFPTLAFFDHHKKMTLVTNRNQPEGVLHELGFFAESRVSPEFDSPFYLGHFVKVKREEESYQEYVKNIFKRIDDSELNDFVFVLESDIVNVLVKDDLFLAFIENIERFNLEGPIVSKIKRALKDISRSESNEEFENALKIVELVHERVHHSRDLNEKQISFLLDLFFIGPISESSGRYYFFKEAHEYLTEAGTLAGAYKFLYAANDDLDVQMKFAHSMLSKETDGKFLSRTTFGFSNGTNIFLDQDLQNSVAINTNVKGSLTDINIEGFGSSLSLGMGYGSFIKGPLTGSFLNLNAGYGVFQNIGPNFLLGANLGLGFRKGLWGNASDELKQLYLAPSLNFVLPFGGLLNPRLDLGFEWAALDLAAGENNNGLGAGSSLFVQLGFDTF